jgi:hypothetical protein
MLHTFSSTRLVIQRSKNHFLPIGNELDALEAVKNQKELLKNALCGPLDNLTLFDINGSVASVAEILFEYQVWIIIGKCQLLLSALIIASTKMPEYQNWDRICQEAIIVFGQCGVPATKKYDN